MNNKVVILIIFIFYVFLNACTERMDLNPEKLAVYLVVDANLTNEQKAHTVHLSKTKLITDTIAPVIANAIVSISDGANEILLEESDTVPGQYITLENYYAEPGKTYTLKINNVDVDGDGVMESYEGSAVMPAYIPVDSVTAERFVYEIFDFKGWWLKCWAFDPPDENYYLFKAWKNDTLLSDTLYEYNLTDDVLFNGQYTNGIECAALVDGKSDEQVRDGDVLTLELCHISEAYYNYLNETMIESSPKVPMFSGPPANVTSNMSDGAVGFFRLYYTTKMSDIAIFDEEEQESD